VPLEGVNVHFTFNKQNMSRPEINLLTPKEYAVLELLAKGLLYKEMADELNVNINTIKKHCKSIYKKLTVRNRTEATLKFNSAKAA
jgi:NarL family two-component system response regulator LiaR